MRKRVLFIFAVLVVILAGTTLLAPALNIALPWNNQLVGRDWRAVTIGEKPVSDTVKISIRFGANGRLDGSDGCNSISGPFSLLAGRLEVGDLTSTAMACDATVMASADSFNAALHTARTASVQSGVLTLKNAAGYEVMTLH